MGLRQIAENDTDPIERCRVHLDAPVPAQWAATLKMVGVSAVWAQKGRVPSGRAQRPMQEGASRRTLRSTIHTHVLAKEIGAVDTGQRTSVYRIVGALGILTIGVPLMAWAFCAAAFALWMNAHPLHDDWLWAQRFKVYSTAFLSVVSVVIGAIACVWFARLQTISVWICGSGAVVLILLMNWVALAAHDNGVYIAVVRVLNPPEEGAVTESSGPTGEAARASPRASGYPGFPGPVEFVVFVVFQLALMAVVRRRLRIVGPAGFIRLWLSVVVAGCCLLLPVTIVVDSFLAWAVSTQCVVGFLLVPPFVMIFAAWYGRRLRC